MINEFKHLRRRTAITTLAAIALMSAPATTRDPDTPPASSPTPADAGVDVDALAQAPDDALDEALDRDDAPDLPLALSLTVSGGVSLGAYQAGYLYYLTEVAKKNPEIINLKLVTGASAGMINTLLTLISLGQEEEPNPEQSLFYKLWTEIRYDELLDVDEAPPLALSSRKLLEELADQVEERWNEGLSQDLDIVLGATATRLETHLVEISEGFTVPRQEEKFVFRVVGRGPGEQPAVTNYVDRTYGAEQPLLPFVDVDSPPRPGQHSNFDVIREILFASSAIPIVFPPQEIEFCMTSPGEAEDESIYALRACPEPTHKAEFYDGSLADRRPLRLAHLIATSGLVAEEGTSVRWQEQPDREQASLPDDFYFFYIDPTRHSFPEDPEEEAKGRAMDEAARLFPSLGVFFRGFLTSARAKEVATLIDEHPEVRERMKLMTHDFPTVSSLMAKFFGFFEREFRRFDFYLGMRDARRYLEHQVTPWIERMVDDRKIALRYPETPWRPDRSKKKRDPWRPYHCLRAAIDGTSNYASTCDSDELKDFRILTQISFDRLYDSCSRLPADETLDHLHCKRAMNGEAPPRVWRVDEEEDHWRRRVEDEESELSHALRLLELYDFHFRDLGLDRGDASLAMSRVRMEMLELLDEFAKKLPFGERLALRLLGKPAINFFHYAPPETIVYVVAGSGAEIAVSATLGQSRWLRFNFALTTQGYSTWITEQANVFTLTPALGLEAELRPLSSPLLQTRLGLRVGFQFSTSDAFVTDPCNTDVFRGDSLRCSAAVAQAMIAFTFYERIRLQGAVEWFPRWLPPMEQFRDDVWNGMISFGWQWISPF